MIIYLYQRLFNVSLLGKDVYEKDCLPDLLLSLLWLAKLSYDVAQYSQIVPQLQQQLTQQQQRYSLLNDQFVAVQRQLQDTHLSEPSEASSLPNMVTGVAPVILIKQQLQLVQFAIDQQQFIYAIDQLNQVQQHIVQYTVSPALQHGLMKAIEQDKQAIQHYVLMQTQQQQQIDTLLQQLDQKLLQEVHNPTIKMQKLKPLHGGLGSNLKRCSVHSLI